jgi:hypothetical protein
MSPSAALDERAFTEVKRLCFSGLDELSLLKEVAARLRGAVPIDGYSAHRIDPLSGLITGAVSEELGGEERARFVFEHLYFEDDVLEYNWMVRSGHPVALLSEATGGKLERSLEGVMNPR